MKIGANDRPKVAVATVSMTLALIITGISIYGWQSSAQATGDVRHEPEITILHGKKTKRTNSLDPTLRYAQLELAENQQYTGSGRNIFKIYVEDEPKTALPDPKPGPLVHSEQRITPEIPLKFFGFAKIKDAPRKVCVRNDDAVFIAREGEIVGSRYKIARISSTSVDVEDLIEDRQQTLTFQPD